MIGTDSHTPNAGGLGMIAIGVGGADAVDVMTGYPFNVRWPKLIGVHLTGELSRLGGPEGRHPQGRRASSPSRAAPAPSSSTSAPAPTRISCTGKATICNMGAEIGATTSLFAYDDAMGRYLESHRPRRDRRRRQRRRRTTCAPTTRSSPTPARFFDQVIEIDLSTLEPLINGPHTPDLARPVGELGAEAAGRGLAARDQRRPRRLVHQLLLRGHHPRRLHRPPGRRRTASAPRPPLLVTPGSEQVRATIERDGLLADLEAIGATVLANACGPCIGQWSRPDVQEGDANIIVTSYNRNFPKRNDGFASTLAFVTSPETVVAMALARPGRLRPHHRHPHQRRRRGGPPRRSRSARSCPRRLRPRRERLPRPPGRRLGRRRSRSPPTSDRLQLLEPFAAWDGKDFVDLPILMKAKGKCTTDHISAAGPWLKYRGHLENISGNLFLGAINAFTDEAGQGKDQLDGEHQALPRHRQALPRGRPALDRHRRRELRRGLAPASTPPWSPASAAPRSSSCAASPASTRPTSRSRACCR